MRASQRALNRLIWGADGRRVITGDAAGYVFLYDVGDVCHFLLFSFSFHFLLSFLFHFLSTFFSTFFSFCFRSFSNYFSQIAVPDANEWNRFEEVLLQLGAAKGPTRPQDDENPATPRDPDDIIP